MQDLSSEDKKTPPKNYQKQPKNYPRIVFGHKNVGFPPIGFRNSRKLATSKITNEYSPLKSNTYEKFKLQKRFSRSTR